MAGKHTPGPWRLICTDGWFTIEATSGTDGQLCQLIVPAFRPDDDEERANLRLLKSAPELLEACKAARHALKLAMEIQGTEGYLNVLYKLQTAIAKAEGTDAP